MNRIKNQYTLFDAEQPEKCPHGIHGHWRVVACCEHDKGIEDGRDIIECSRCGQQRSARCNFDEDCS